MVSLTGTWLEGIWLSGTHLLEFAQVNLLGDLDGKNYAKWNLDDWNPSCLDLDNGIIYGAG